MTRVFITGSADGLGLELGRRLASAAHEVVLHGRSDTRAAEARAAVPGVFDALAGDLASVAQTRALGEWARALGPFDAIVHNAGLGFREARAVTEDGVEHVFAVNVLAPYVLTALVPAPRLIYLSSALHERGEPNLDDLAWERRPWNPMRAYCDSKLLDAALAFAVARRWPDVLSAAVEPGWIATKMGGDNAPGTLQQGTETQLSLVTEGGETGRLYRAGQPVAPKPLAEDRELQERLLAVCAEVSGVTLPETPGL